MKVGHNLSCVWHCTHDTVAAAFHGRFYTGDCYIVLKVCWWERGEEILRYFLVLLIRLSSMMRQSWTGTYITGSVMTQRLVHMTTCLHVCVCAHVCLCLVVPIHMSVCPSVCLSDVWPCVYRLIRRHVLLCMLSTCGTCSMQRGGVTEKSKGRSLKSLKKCLILASATSKVNLILSVVMWFSLSALFRWNCFRILCCGRHCKFSANSSIAFKSMRASVLE